jgi:pantoate--beta-alanine ligase
MEVGGIQALRRWRARQSGRVGLVPTMGALHSGHQALMTRARAESDLVVTSIFVNPLQFGADEDFVQYPRPIASDLAKCEEAGVDFVFAPALGEMYPSAPEVRVVAGRMGAVFEGEARPGHFDGVLTVVAKLFNLIKPDVTVFGLKDIQQFCLVKRMIADLDFDIEIIGLPVVRDADGLAMSSRNEYLSPSDRERALAIPRALDAAAEVAAGGVREGPPREGPPREGPTRGRPSSSRLRTASCPRRSSRLRVRCSSRRPSAGSSTSSTSASSMRRPCGPVRPTSGDRRCCSSRPSSAAPTSSTTCRWNSEVHRVAGSRPAGRIPPVTGRRSIPEHTGNRLDTEL